MTLSYTKSPKCATAPDNLTTSDKVRASFARSAVSEEFRSRDARALDQADFQDRPPHRQPARLGNVTADITSTIARRAVRHWTKEAALALSPRERDEALSIAHKIALKAGLEFSEDRERAA